MYEIDQLHSFQAVQARGITSSSLLVCGGQTSRQRAETAREPSTTTYVVTAPVRLIMIRTWAEAGARRTRTVAAAAAAVVVVLSTPWDGHPHLIWQTYKREISALY